MDHVPGVSTATRSKSAESVANLKVLYPAERAYFQESDRYSVDAAEIGFDPERGNR